MARILVIDDEAGLRRLVRRFLERGGSHEVFEASNGREGLARFHECPADVVICDLAMPEMNGLETIAAIHDVSPASPIIAISGGARSSELLRDAVALGVVQALPKPISMEQILTAVEEALVVVASSAERPTALA